MLCCVGCSSFVDANGALSVQGTQLVNQHGQPIVLKGVSYAWHEWAYPFYNAQTVATLKNQWNVNVVRASLGVEPRNGYLEQPQLGLDCITTVVDAAIKKGLYAIIDWHSHHIRTAEAVAFFTQMATRYKGVPNVIYEIYNEPVDDTWAEVKAYSQTVIDAIRRVEPHAVVLVGCPHWDQDIHLVADDPLQGYDNILYTVHFYAGTHKSFLRERAQYALAKGIPLFFSECGAMDASGDGPLDEASWQEWLAWLQERQISWVAWSMSQKDEACSMIQPGSPTDGHWNDEDLKPWAHLVMQSLL